MGFVKGVVTGVIAVAGVVVGAAVVSVIKDEKKEKVEMQKASEEMDKAYEDDRNAYKEGMKQFEKQIGNKLDKMSNGIRDLERNINEKPSGETLSS